MDYKSIEKYLKNNNIEYSFVSYGNDYLINNKVDYLCIKKDCITNKKEIEKIENICKHLEKYYSKNYKISVDRYYWPSGAVYNVLICPFHEYFVHSSIAAITKKYSNLFNLLHHYINIKIAIEYIKKMEATIKNCEKNKIYNEYKKMLLSGCYDIDIKHLKEI